MSTDTTTAEVRPTRYRRLRIAWSVMWGVVAVLLCVLWVRSYYRADIVRSKALLAEAISVRGKLKLSRIDHFPASPNFDSYPFGERAAEVIDEHVHRFSESNGFGLYGGRSVLFPYSFAAACSLVMAAAAWVTRFSLRTMLVATTLIAVGLGLIIWLAK